MRTDVRRMCCLVQFMPTSFLCYLMDEGWGVVLDDEDGLSVLRSEVGDRVTYIAFCRILPHLRLYRNSLMCDQVFGLHMTLCDQPFLVPVPQCWRHDMAKRSISLKNVNDVLIFVLFGQWIQPALRPRASSMCVE